LLNLLKVCIDIFYDVMKSFMLSIVLCCVCVIKQMMQEMGNSRARAVYEANVPDDFRRPQSD